jgi:hypothetical protein
MPEIAQETDVNSFTIRVTCYNYRDEKFMARSNTHLPRYEDRTAVLMKMKFMEFYAMLIYLLTDIFQEL